MTRDGVDKEPPFFTHDTVNKASSKLGLDKEKKKEGVGVNAKIGFTTLHQSCYVGRCVTVCLSN